LSTWQNASEEVIDFAGNGEKAGEGDFLRAVAEAVLQLLMEADASSNKL
jgi:hypothetical protein